MLRGQRQKILEQRLIAQTDAIRPHHALLAHVPTLLALHQELRLDSQQFREYDQFVPARNKVLFVTREGGQLRIVNDDGSLGDRIDQDDLEMVQHWMKKTRPIH